ncbi:YdeI/OmpD-associated family protein [Cryobacterium mannosilyticum]|uniref:Bacteriocin-protection protein, YdeI/OmpD-associated family n=1 Tax=Cryobacterium mannosilyticum TaxID=1259190 RepID=A0A4R8WFV5_9MICO|nr:YdeI/OmpD-associated family protein [Cryobacterium mannosilyticum]TFC06792.1 bacteriocin-protection protein, YdeI/OmpD-associated family [Cryobacterium mannosilyticum]
MGANADKPILLFETVADWEAWLEQNAGHDGVRLQLRKKKSVVPGITYPLALESALCFGWIDGQAGSLDDDYHLQVFTPRRARSVWSQRNQGLVAALIADGRMRPAGHAEIDRARADGRWEVAYRQKDSPVPEDLRVALDANPAASSAFATLDSQNRFAILFRINAVKRAQTRAAKIAGYVEMLADGRAIYPR